MSRRQPRKPWTWTNNNSTSNPAYTDRPNETGHPTKRVKTQADVNAEFIKKITNKEDQTFKNNIIQYIFDTLLREGFLMNEDNDIKFTLPSVTANIGTLTVTVQLDDNFIELSELNKVDEKVFNDNLKEPVLEALKHGPDYFDDLIHELVNQNPLEVFRPKFVDKSFITHNRQNNELFENYFPEDLNRLLERSHSSFYQLQVKDFYFKVSKELRTMKIQFKLPLINPTAAETMFNITRDQFRSALEDHQNNVYLYWISRENLMTRNFHSPQLNIKVTLDLSSIFSQGFLPKDYLYLLAIQFQPRLKQELQTFFRSSEADSLKDRIHKKAQRIVTDVNDFNNRQPFFYNVAHKEHYGEDIYKITFGYRFLNVPKELNKGGADFQFANDPESEPEQDPEPLELVDSGLPGADNANIDFDIANLLGNTPLGDGGD